MHLDLPEYLIYSVSDPKWVQNLRVPLYGELTIPCCMRKAWYDRENTKYACRVG